MYVLNQNRMFKVDAALIFGVECYNESMKSIYVLQLSISIKIVLVF
jgi:hypothetical protein